MQNEQFFVQGNNRMRGAPRNQPVVTDNIYNRYPSAFPSAGMVPPINTFAGQPGAYDYPTQPMSAVPYAPYMEPYHRLGAVSIQL
jgi:la-related protein 1